MKRIVKRLLLTAAAEGVAVMVAFVLIDVRDQRQEVKRRERARQAFWDVSSDSIIKLP